ncbi:MAG: hypothetical protein K0M40_05630 [Prolixibacteraceae bacterium]|nr:hypothetical protein [Prolixibacteraceae bacterium]
MPPLQPDTSYHIFNHANGFENVFRKEENFYFFLEKYRLYISPIAETYAYCLMPNHFHLVVRIRKRVVIEELIRNKNNPLKGNNFSNFNNFSKVSNPDRSVSITQNEFDKTKSVNFGKVSTIVKGKVSTIAKCDQTKSVNFGKVSTIAEYDKTTKDNFSKVSNPDRSVSITQNESDKAKSVNFGKVSTIAKGKVSTIAECDQTKSVNFGKVSTIVEYDKTTKDNFSKVSNRDRSVGITQNESDKAKSANFGKVEEIKISNNEIEKYLSKQFANLFSSYTQSFNKVYRRMGSLFIKNFKREPIHDKTHFLNAIVYTHRNPVHHGFCSNYEDWEYSSYNEIMTGVYDQTELEKLLKMTNGIESFKEMHRNALENFSLVNELEIPSLDD